MKFLPWIVLISLSFAVHDAASAATFTLPEAEVSFNAPDGFSPLTSEEIRLLYQTAQPPKHAVGNEEGTITIGYDLYDTPYDWTS